MEALPEIKTELFGKRPVVADFLQNAFVGGMLASLETIRVEHGEHWAPYRTCSTTPSETLNQIANLELTQLVNTGINMEQAETIPIFENLFEICFYLTRHRHHASFYQPTRNRRIR